MNHIINDLNLADGLLYHEKTGQSLAEFGKVARFQQLALVTDAIRDMSLAQVREVLGGEVNTEDGEELLGELLAKFLRDGLESLGKELGEADLDAVRTAASGIAERAKLDIRAEDYYRCVGCLVWLWEHRKQGSDLSFEGFLEETTLEGLQTRFVELVVRSQGGVPAEAEVDGDSPLVASSPI